MSASQSASREAGERLAKRLGECHTVEAVTAFLEEADKDAQWAPYISTVRMIAQRRIDAINFAAMAITRLRVAGQTLIDALGPMEGGKIPPADAIRAARNELARVLEST